MSDLRHYEIVLLVHPDQSEQVEEMTKRYVEVVTKSGGSVHRQEDWGRLQLAYPVKRAHKAHYLLMNIESDEKCMAELTGMFRFNDAIIRQLIVRKNHAETEPSSMQKAANGKGDKDFEGGRRRQIRVPANVVANMDYKSISLLKSFIMENGRIVPRRITGVSSAVQRKVADAIKKARYLSLLHYCDMH